MQIMQRNLQRQTLENLKLKLKQEGNLGLVKLPHKSNKQKAGWKIEKGQIKEIDKIINYKQLIKISKMKKKIQEEDSFLL